MTDFSALLNPADARHDLAHVHPGWTATLRVVKGGDLLLPTGRLVACEPTMHLDEVADELAFSQRVEPGSYPVELLVADIFDADGGAVDVVNAAARLVVRDEPVTSWRMATQDGQDGADLAEDSFYGYSVDGGMGGFASPEVLVALGTATYEYDDSPFEVGPSLSRDAAEALNKVAADLREDDGSMDPGRAERLRMLLALEREVGRLNLPRESGTVGVCTDQATSTNIVSFRSGYGDGHYGTWIGYTSGDAVACFLTDFMVMTE